MVWFGFVLREQLHLGVIWWEIQVRKSIRGPSNKRSIQFIPSYRMLHLFAVLMVLINSTCPKAPPAVLTSGCASCSIAQTAEVAQCSHQKISRNELMPIWDHWTHLNLSVVDVANQNQSPDIFTAVWRWGNGINIHCGSHVLQLSEMLLLTQERRLEGISVWSSTSTNSSSDVFF